MVENNEGYWGLPLDKDTLTQINVRGQILAQEYKTLEQLEYINANAPWILFRSGVDISGSNDSTEAGSALAKRYILSGGTLSASGANFQSRAGISYIDRNNNAAYNPTGYDNRTGFGVRPMPGITSISVKPKDTWGFIMEATINFSVWSVDDLEAINKLYFRPGFIALLEWGHSVYVDNSGTVRYAGTNVGNTVSPISNEEWFDPTKISNKQGDEDNLQYFEGKIKKQRDLSCGNYDGLCGYIINFSYTLGNNGEWKCTVKMLSRSAKIASANLGASKIDSEDEDVAKKGNTIFDRIYDKLKANSRLPIVDTVIEDSTPDKLGTREACTIEGKSFVVRWRNPNHELEYVKTLGSTVSSRGISYSKDNSETYTRTDITAASSCISLNSIQDGLDDFPVFRVKIRGRDDLYYLRIFDILNIMQCDSNTFVLPGKKYFDLKSTYTYSNLNVLLSVPGIKDVFVSIDPFEVQLPYNVSLKYSEQKSRYPYAHVIGNTLVNLNSLTSIIAANVDVNGQCNVGGVLGALMNMVQKNLGDVPNLGLIERDNYVAIVDRNRVAPLESDTELISLSGLSSTVESFSIASDITDNLANEISIAAQAPASSMAGLVSWNYGLIDRIEGTDFTRSGMPRGTIRVAGKSVYDPEYVEPAPESTEAKVDMTLSTLYEKFWTNDSDVELEDKFKAEFSTVSSKYKSAIKVSAKEGFADLVGVFPIKLDLTMKGISKLYIGLCFGIKPGLLPKIYDDWRYIITGVTHDVSGTGWKTSIVTQYCPPGKDYEYK